MYSFDADWGNDAYWAACCGYSPYDYFEQDRRERSTIAEDLRVIGDADHMLFGRLRWLAGAYFMRLTESDSLLDTWNDEFIGSGFNLLHSDYQATNAALYGSLDAALGPRSSLTLGLRAEQRLAHYQDSADVERPFPDERNAMYGGNLSWSLRTSQQQSLYATLARGYKGGGFNIGSQIPADERRFAPEYLWSLESGLKRASASNSLQWQADVFYMRRESMQVYSSCQLEQDNPATFVFFTQNASNGENYGLEARVNGDQCAAAALDGAGHCAAFRYLGRRCVFDPPAGLAPRCRRLIARARKLSILGRAVLRPPERLFARIDTSATDGFYFAAGQNQVAQAYQLVHVRIGYQRGGWQTSVWSRNLLDQRYAVQGFYFGDVPPNFPNQRFIQNGDPRTVGVTVRYQLGHNED